MPNLAWFDDLRDVRFLCVYIGVVTYWYFFVTPIFGKNVVTESMADFGMIAIFCVNIDFFLVVINSK